MSNVHIAKAAAISLLIGATSPSAASGQMVRVARLNPPSGQLVTSVQRQLQVTVNPQALRAVGGVGAIQVRILRGSRSDQRNARRTDDGCLVLPSDILIPSDLGAGRLNLQFSFTKEWIRIRDGRPANEVYTLVFELRNTAGQMLKLDAQFLDAYLQSSIEVVLQPPTNLSPQEIAILAPLSQPVPTRITHAGACWRVSGRDGPVTQFAADLPCRRQRRGERRAQIAARIAAEDSEPALPLLVGLQLDDMITEYGNRRSWGWMPHVPVRY